MGELTAPVAGTVVKVAATGERLAPGAAVVVVESMKMEYEVVAESGGEVVRLDVAVGELVAEGQRVAAVEPGGERVAATPDAGSGAALEAVLARHALGRDEARPEAVAR